MIHEIFKTLVIQYKLVSVEYFMDKMQIYEMFLLLDNLEYANVSSLEMVRWLAYMTSVKLPKRINKPQDLMVLPTDPMYLGSKKTINDWSDEDIDRMEQDAQEIAKKLNLSK